MLYGLVKRSFHLNKNYFTFIKISGKFTLELEGRGLFWKSSVMEKLLEWNIWEGGGGADTSYFLHQYMYFGNPNGKMFFFIFQNF